MKAEATVFEAEIDEMVDEVYALVYEFEGLNGIEGRIDVDKINRIINFMATVIQRAESEAARQGDKEFAYVLLWDAAKALMMMGAALERRLEG